MLLKKDFICDNFMFVFCTCIKPSKSKTASLEGTWELNYATGPKIAFEDYIRTKSQSSLSI